MSTDGLCNFLLQIREGADAMPAVAAGDVGSVVHILIQSEIVASALGAVEFNRHHVEMVDLQLCCTERGHDLEAWDRRRGGS